MMKDLVLQTEKWAKEGIEPRVIASLIQAKPETPNK